MQLFNTGNYTGVIALVSGTSDPALLLLAARSYAETGQYDTAGYLLRDLIQIMPGSSYLHSYLADVMKKTGDEHAVSEYATALILDPENRPALRNYARLLIPESNEWCPPRLEHHPRTHLPPARPRSSRSTRPRSPENAYRSALDSFEEEQMDNEEVAQIRFSFILLEKLLGNYDAARYELGLLLKSRTDPVYRLLEAELAARTGHGDDANTIYRSLIAEECSKDAEIADPAMQEFIITRFKAFLDSVRSKEEVAGIISVLLSSYPTAVCLTQIGAAYEEARACTQARDWYYRAYRADYIHGGIAYAAFLKRLGEDRECETVIRYILTNITRAADIERVAGVVLNGKEAMYRIPKVMEQILARPHLGTRKTLLQRP